VEVKTFPKVERGENQYRPGPTLWSINRKTGQETSRQEPFEGFGGNWGMDWRSLSKYLPPGSLEDPENMDVRINPRTGLPEIVKVKDEDEGIGEGLMGSDAYASESFPHTARRVNPMGKPVREKMTKMNGTPTVVGTEEVEEGIASPSIFGEGSYEDNVTNFGVDVADALEDIESAIMELDSHDSLILEIMRELYKMLGTEGQMELATSGF
jgi:hypothetical protein